MAMFSKDVKNFLFTLAILVILYGAYKIFFTVREGKKGKNDCFTTGSGVGCHRFYKSKLPTDGNYFDMIKKCKNDKNCKICVEAAATLDPKTIGGIKIEDKNLDYLGELMGKPEQNCRLKNRQKGLLERNAIII